MVYDIKRRKLQHSPADYAEQYRVETKNQKKDLFDKRPLTTVLNKVRSSKSECCEQPTRDKTTLLIIGKSTSCAEAANEDVFFMVLRS